MNAIISHTINASEIQQRADDGYIHATAMCQAAGKHFPHYMTNDTTQEYMNALSLDVGIPTSKLVKVIKGRGDRVKQGTWVHPKVAIHLAQWLSPDFAVQVTNWVYDWMNGRTPIVPDFSNPAAAARAWAEQYEALEEAKRIRHLLEQKLDQAGQFATVKRMQAYYGKSFNWRKLKKASNKLGQLPVNVHDANYGTVKAYHETAWTAAYGLEIPAISGGQSS